MSGEEREFEIDYGKPHLKIHPIVLLVFFGGLLLFSVGIGMAFFKSQESGGVEIISAGQVQGESVSEVVVHVDGGVARPGVYKLSSDLRVNDAIEAAGGLTGGAQVTGLNLAAKLTDGQKIFVPSLIQNSNIKNQNVGSESVASQFVSINSGTQAELESLPGVGPVTAKKIIDGRPYGALEELLAKKAVGKATFEKIKDLIGL